MSGNLEPGYFRLSPGMDEPVANAFAKLLGVPSAPFTDEATGCST
jgi:hypothetical protein